MPQHPASDPLADWLISMTLYRFGCFPTSCLGQFIEFTKLNRPLQSDFGMHIQLVSLHNINLIFSHLRLLIRMLKTRVSRESLKRDDCQSV